LLYHSVGTPLKLRRQILGLAIVLGEAAPPLLKPFRSSLKLYLFLRI
jgi:hypothetical protein